MKTLFAMAVPILPGKTAQFRKFGEELNTTYFEGLNESRKKLNVRERAFYQKTPMGDLVIVTVEGENPEEAFKKFGEGNDAFTKWFAKEVKEIHGIDLTSPPKGDLPELVIDSQYAHVLHH